MNQVTLRSMREGEALAPVENLQAPVSAFDRPDFSLIYRAVISNYRLILGVALIGMLIAYFALKSMTPQFTAKALIMLDGRGNILDETTSVFAGLPIADTYIDSEIELIRSDAIVRRVIETQGLMDDPEFASDKIPPGIKMLIEEQQQGVLVAEPGQDENILTDVQKLQVAQQLRRRLTVLRQGLSQGIVVSFRSRSQRKARDIANAFAENYVSDQLANKRTASFRATSWLQDELDKLAVETQTAERAVEEYRAQHTLVGEGDQGVGAQQLKTLTSQMALARAEQSEAEAKLAQLNAIKRQGGSLLSLPEIAERRAIVALLAELNESDREEAELASRYKTNAIEDIPPYQEARARRRSVEQSLRLEIARAAQEFETNAAAAAAITASLESDLSELRANNAEINAAAIGLNELERVAEGKRRRYETLLAQYNDADNAAAVITPHARIVSPAELPLSPSAPRKKAAFAAAAIASFGLGLFAALFREFTRRNIRTPDELRAAAHMRAIGATPRIAKGRNEVASAMNLVVKAPDHEFCEAIRSLRAEISLTQPAGACNIIAVTAPHHCSSSGALAASLARSIAYDGIETLLVDADLRHPEILPKLYKNRKRPDLIAALHGETDWRAAIEPSRNPRLDILGPHAPAGDTGALLAFAEHFGEWLDQWRNNYRTIIINTPAALEFPEARMISAYCDHVLLSVQWNAADRRDVLSAVELLAENGASPKAVLADIAPGVYRQIIGGERFVNPFQFRVAQAY